LQGTLGENGGPHGGVRRRPPPRHHGHRVARQTAAPTASAPNAETSRWRMFSTSIPTARSARSKAWGHPDHSRDGCHLRGRDPHHVPPSAASADDLRVKMVTATAVVAALSRLTGAGSGSSRSDVLSRARPHD
jgi:hypothetical protein